MNGASPDELVATDVVLPGLKVVLAPFGVLTDRHSHGPVRDCVAVGVFDLDRRGAGQRRVEVLLRPGCTGNVTPRGAASGSFALTRNPLLVP